MFALDEEKTSTDLIGRAHNTAQLHNPTKEVSDLDSSKTQPKEWKAPQENTYNCNVDSTKVDNHFYFGWVIRDSTF